MCLAFDEERLSGVCGSPSKSLEVFTLSEEKASIELFKVVSKLHSLQSVLEKRYSVELRNAGVADVSVRQDGKIMSSGGWDGRYACSKCIRHTCSSLGLHSVRVFGWKKGKPLAILNYHSAAVHCISFTGYQTQLEDTNLMICGSKDERISLWKLY